MSYLDISELTKSFGEGAANRTRRLYVCTRSHGRAAGCCLRPASEWCGLCVVQGQK